MSRGVCPHRRFTDAGHQRRVGRAASAAADVPRSTMKLSTHMSLVLVSSVLIVLTRCGAGFHLGGWVLACSIRVAIFSRDADRRFVVKPDALPADHRLCRLLLSLASMEQPAMTPTIRAPPIARATATQTTATQIGTVGAICRRPTRSAPILRRLAPCTRAAGPQFVQQISQSTTLIARTLHTLGPATGSRGTGQGVGPHLVPAVLSTASSSTERFFLSHQFALYGGRAPATAMLAALFPTLGHVGCQIRQSLLRRRHRCSPAAPARHRSKAWPVQFSTSARPTS